MACVTASTLLQQVQKSKAINQSGTAERNQPLAQSWTIRCIVPAVTICVSLVFFELSRPAIP